MTKVQECLALNIKKYRRMLNITQEQLDSGVTYIELMRNNVTALKEALS